MRLILLVYPADVINDESEGIVLNSRYDQHRMLCVNQNYFGTLSTVISMWF